MGHKFIKNNKIIQGAGPADINGSGLTGDYVSMKNYNHCTVILNFGAIGAANTVTLKQATDVSGTSEKALSFTEYFKKEGTSTDTFTRATCSSTFNTGTTSNSVYVVEIDANDLDVDNGFDCLRVNIADPGASTIVGVTYILSEPRYADDSMPAAITD